MIRTLLRVAACALAALEAVPARAQYYRADFPPGENLHRVDVVVLTADGVESFTAFLPSELADMEKRVRQKGIVQTPPLQALP